MNRIVHFLHLQGGVQGGALVAPKNLRHLKKVAPDRTQPANISFGSGRLESLAQLHDERSWIRGLNCIEDELTPCEKV